MLKLFTKSPWGGPWHSGGNSGGSNAGTEEKNGKNPIPQNPEKEQAKTSEGKIPPKQYPWGGNSKPNSTGSELDEAVKKAEELVRKLFGGGGNKGGGGGNNSNKLNNFGAKSPKSLVGLIALGLVVFWLCLGFYKVDSDENATVLYFGKFYSISTPGLNYYIPYPFGQVIKKSVTTVNTEEFGFSSAKKSERDFEAESLMLTGDENIVDIEFQVQWQIADIKDFVFNIVEPNQTIRKSAESAMREVIARTPIAQALSDGKKKIEQETKDLLQEMLDFYKAGVRITLVQLRRVDPPSQVRDAFLDVQAARADKEKEINQAQAYANDIIPRARGTAAKMKEDAEAYSQEVVTKSQGEAGRFMSVYNQYVRAKQVTKKRIYLETMEKIYRDMDKVFIDKSAARSSVMPYFPMSEIGGQKQQTPKN